MVVQIIDQFYLVVEHPENNAPVTADTDGPVVDQIAFQSVKPPAGQVQFITVFGSIQNQQYTTQAFCMVCVDTFGRTSLKKDPEAFMFPANDHGEIVM